MYNYILFDLDGTLTDPCEGILNSILYALGKLSIEEKDRQALKSFIGPPLYESFMERYSMSLNEALEAVNLYREYFAEKGLYENAVYKGIRETLSALAAEGRKLVLATSKPYVFAQKILDHFGLSKYFYFLSGATLDNTRVEKADIIAYALSSCNISEDDAVMVGDRKHDISGAKANAVKSIGVLYGYGSEEELRKAGADCLATDPEDIIKCIEKLEK